MKHLDALKGEDLAQVREYIKQNASEEFFQDLKDHKELTTPLMLKAKSLPEGFVTLFKNQEEASFLLQECVSANFTPSLSFLESFKNFGDESLLSVVKAYPKLPWTMQFLMEIINLSLFESAFVLISHREEFKKPEVLSLLFKNSFENEEFYDMILKDETMIDLVGKALSSSKGKIAPSLINKYFLTVENYPMDVKTAIGLVSSGPALKAVLEKKSVEKNNGYGYYGYYNSTQLEYDEEFEQIESFLFQKHGVFLKKVPQGSIHRSKYVLENPREANDEELLKLINSTSLVSNKKHSSGEQIMEAALCRSLEFVKLIPVNKIEGSAGPKTLADMTNSNDVRLYLLEKLSSKYSKALREKLPKEIQPAENNSRKKSYFNECYEALGEGKVDLFRSFLRGTYTFGKFVEDTNQKSKKASCEKYLSKDLYYALTKEEFMAFMLNTPFRSYYSYHDEEKGKKLSHSFSVGEASSLHETEKLSVGTLFENCTDHLGFIQNVKLDGGDLFSLQESCKHIIFPNPTLLTAFLNALKPFETLSYSLDDIQRLAEVLTAKDLRGFAKNLDYWAKRSLVLVKGTDGEYFLTEDDIKMMLQSPDTFESDEFIRDLMMRDKTLAVALVTAYNKGNKAMTELLGVPVNIRRTSKDKFKALLNEMNHSVEDLVEEVFSSGGKLEDFSKKILDWKEALKNFGKGRTIVIDRADNYYSEKFVSLPNVKVQINILELKRSWSCRIPQEILDQDNFDIRCLELAHLNEETLAGLGLDKMMKKYPNMTLDVTGLGFSAVVYMLQNKMLSEESKAPVMEQIATGEWLTKEHLSLEILTFLENYIVFTPQIVAELCDRYSEELEILQWIKSRVGDLSHVYLDEKDCYGYSNQERKEDHFADLTALGIKVLNHDDFVMKQTQDKLLQEGKNFQEIKVSSWAISQKVRLIKFIEKEIDSEYVKLNLASLNLEEVDEIYSYSVMKTLYSLDDQDLIQIFSIPASVASNKKILKSLRDLITVTGSSLSMKVVNLKEIIEVLNPKVELVFADFVNYSNQASLEIEDNISKISSETLSHLQANLPAIKESKLLLYNKDKSHILRFMRSTSEHGASYLRDTIQMISAVVNGAAALRDRAAALEAEQNEDNVDTINELKQSALGIADRLAEVALMDNIEHMHDRLVTLAKFLKEDPAQPLGQDRYKRLENSAELQKGLGHKVFFPRTRGDLQYLGEKNGWCVSYHASYGDNVIAKGNVLVGICEKEAQESTKENVIALAHFVHDGKGGYSLEQLKWSSRIKGRQVDGTNDFKYGIILSHVKEFMAKRREEAKEK